MFYSNIHDFILSKTKERRQTENWTVPQIINDELQRKGAYTATNIPSSLGGVSSGKSPSSTFVSGRPNKRTHRRGPTVEKSSEKVSLLNHTVNSVEVTFRRSRYPLPSYLVVTTLILCGPLPVPDRLGNIPESRRCWTSFQVGGGTGERCHRGGSKTGVGVGPMRGRTGTGDGTNRDGVKPGRGQFWYRQRGVV